jgi:type IV pilus assembly protein PilW
MMSKYNTTAMAKSRMTGFTLVELMVSMTLSLILLAGALSILYSTKLTSSENERVARIQEAGRTALELIRQDARASGYAGCSRPHNASYGFTYNTLGLNNNTLLWDFSKPISGFEATGGTWSPVLDAAIPASPAPAAGSDVMVLRTVRAGSPIFRTNAGASGSAAISVDRDPNILLGGGIPFIPTPMVIGDCRTAEVFIASGWTPTGATATIAHAAGGAPAGNTSGSLTNSYQIGAMLQPVQTVVYYVASCTAVGGPCTAITPPALWQIAATDTAGGAQPQELIQGVEAMQIKYGVDTDGDFLANNYVTADLVTDWTKVVSINLAILIRSIDQTGVEKDTKTYTLLGQNYGPFNDRRSRSVYTTTISLRNDTT